MPEQQEPQTLAGVVVEQVIKARLWLARQAAPVSSS
jgi:hypothetical protein